LRVAAPLTDEQQQYLCGVARAVQLQLQPVGDHFDRAGCTAPEVPDAVRRLACAAHAVGVHLHYFDCNATSGRVPGHPVKPVPAVLCCGEGI
jgi:hypothetical protein